MSDKRDKNISQIMNNIIFPRVTSRLSRDAGKYCAVSSWLLPKNNNNNHHHSHHRQSVSPADGVCFIIGICSRTGCVFKHTTRPERVLIGHPADRSFALSLVRSLHVFDTHISAGARARAYKTNMRNRARGSR